METINKYLTGVCVPVALAFFALFFLIKLKGRPLNKSIFMLKNIFKGEKRNGVSPLRAVIFALAGTLGVGNIVGVASAMALGGAGSVLWMWISALLAMILKYCEVVLAVRHRRNRNGENYGGAMYYMKDFFDSCKKHGFGYIFILIFVIFCLANGFTMGCMIQSNSIARAFEAVFELNGNFIAIILAILGIVVFFFNGKKIFALCEKLVPFVSAIYLIMSLSVILISYREIPRVLCSIFNDAFSFRSAGAGILGFFTSRALRYGTIRGLFSNEAGCGTAPIAHATSNTNSACEQGFLGIIEVFIDTVLVCSMTAFVILLNWDVASNYVLNPIMMAFSGFSSSIGYFSNILLSFSVFLFAFATIICWGYYGKECIYFLNKSKRAENIYYCIYILLICLGCIISLDIVWEIADLAVGVMTLMNLLILALMCDEIKTETDNYFIKKSFQKGSSNNYKIE